MRGPERPQEEREAVVVEGGEDGVGVEVGEDEGGRLEIDCRQIHTRASVRWTQFQSCARAQDRDRGDLQTEVERRESRDGKCPLSSAAKAKNHGPRNPRRCLP